MEFLIINTIFISLFFSESIEDTQVCDIDQTPILRFGRKTYYLETFEKNNWFYASMYCNNLGMQLVSIDSMEEWRFLKKHFEQKKTIDDSIWISLNNLLEYRLHSWASNGMPFNSDMNEGMERDIEAYQSDPEYRNDSCGILDISEGYKMHKSGCENFFYMFCEDVPYKICRYKPQ